MGKFGKGVKAVFEIIDEAAKVREEKRETERKYRAVVENAIKEYEAITGQTFHRREEAALLVSSTGLPWSATNPGHLVNCSHSCFIKHCLTCGKEAWTDVYCPEHR